MAMAGTGNARGQPHEQVPLPPGAYRYLKDLPAINPGQLLNVVGIVTDFRPPIPCKGKDYKAQFSFFDLSTENDHDSMVDLHVFRPPEKMPTEVKAGDLIVVLQAKRQGFQGTSLITSRNTHILLFDQHKIPRYPGSAEVAMRVPTTKMASPLSPVAFKYVSWVHQQATRSCVPDEVEFERRKDLASHVKDKFSLLGDLQPETFRDVTVRLVRNPHDLGDKITIWVSDYTENEGFFCFNPENGFLPTGDDYGYTSQVTDEPGSRTWSGPLGKLSMQITCWEPHATNFREYNIQIGDWVTLKNVHIRVGRNGNNIEGFLREDRAHPNRVQMIFHDEENIDPHSVDEKLIEALRRMKRHDNSIRRAQKENRREALSEDPARVDVANAKRQATEDGVQAPAKKKSKQQRKMKRARQAAVKAGMEAAEKEDEEALVKVLNLNPDLRVEHVNEPITPIARLLEPTVYRTTINGESRDIPLPFVNANYRTVGRVVDFWPRNISKFASSRKTSMLDFVSDDLQDEPSIESGDEDHDDDDPRVLDAYRGRLVWEWRFSLQIEDTHPSSKGEKKRFWVVVDNFAAQCLFSMDAKEIQTPGTLARLRQKLSTLWGNLENQKKAGSDVVHGGGHSLVDPPLHSDEVSSQPPAIAQVSSQPFTFCVKEYGIQVKAGKKESSSIVTNGKKWERVFSLFGVKISS